MKGRRRRRTTTTRKQLINDFRNRSRCWQLKEATEDKKNCGNDSLSYERRNE